MPAGALRRRLATALATFSLAGAALGLASASTVTVDRQGDFDVSGTAATVSDHARVAVTNDGTVHVVWEEGLDVYHRYRRPSGEWSTPIVLYYGASQPAIATDGTTVAAAFVQDGREAPYDKTTVYVAFWDSDLGAWSQAGPQAVDLSEDGNQPDLAFSRYDGGLWVAWSDYTYDAGRPYLAEFRGPTVVSASPCGNFDASQGPAIAIDAEGSVFIARTDVLLEGDESEIGFAERRAGTATCSDGPPLFGETRSARNPDIVASSDALCLVWHEDTPGTGEDVVLGCRSGTSWLTWDLSNTASAVSAFPRLFMDPTVGLLSIWQEHESDRDTIRFRQGPPPPPGAQAVTTGQVETEAPDLYFRQGYAHAVWTEWNASGGADIQYANWKVDPPTPTPTPSATVTATRTASATRTATATTAATTPTPRPGGDKIYLPLASTVAQPPRP